MKHPFGRPLRSFSCRYGNLSGRESLRRPQRPQKSHPQRRSGAVSEITIGLIIPVALAWTTEPEVLRTNSMIWNELGYIPFIVIPAVWGAIISSAFGSILGAPRTLQARCNRLVPHRLGQIDPKTGEPTLDFMYRAQWRSVPSS